MILKRHETPFFIRSAEKGDLSQIVEIANALRLQSYTEEAQNHGFLVSEIDEEAYSEILEQSDFFKVLIVDKEVISFVFGYSSDSRALPEIHLKAIREFSDEDFIFIHQIATKPEHRDKGWGRMLYHQALLFREKRAAYASTILSPPNHRSVRLHENMGFTLAFDTSEKQVTRSYWRLAPIDRDSKALVEQYNVAERLYLHEDGLNWRKISALFYVTAALIAACGFIAKIPVETGFRFLVPLYFALVGAIGCVMALGFKVTIRSGIHYMNVRKRTFIEIDRVLSAVTGNRIVTHAKNAPTTNILAKLPDFFAYGWGGFSVIHLLGFFILLFIDLASPSSPAVQTPQPSVQTSQLPVQTPQPPVKTSTPAVQEKTKKPSSTTVPTESDNP